jgi:hypothetical protein
MAFAARTWSYSPTWRPLCVWLRQEAAQGRVNGGLIAQLAAELIFTAMCAIPFQARPDGPRFFSFFLQSVFGFKPRSVPL